MRAVGAARTRRRGGAAAAIAPESKGETDGEQEEVAGDLTGGSFCAKEGRRKVVGGEGRSSASETSTSSSARFRSLLRGRRREERDGTGSFKAFARIRAPTPRSGAIADAWSGADEHSRRYGRRASQCRAGDALFLRLNDFNSNSTS